MLFLTYVVGSLLMLLHLPVVINSFSPSTIVATREARMGYHVNLFAASSKNDSNKARSQNVYLQSTVIVEPPPTKEQTEKVIERKKDSDSKEETGRDFKRGGWAVRLFNDPFNKREFVAMCLSKIVGLTDGQSYQVMMQAHQNGVAIVGRFDYERAELYKTSLIEHGLQSDMIPVDDD